MDYRHARLCLDKHNVGEYEDPEEDCDQSVCISKLFLLRMHVATTYRQYLHSWWNVFIKPIFIWNEFPSVQYWYSVFNLSRPCWSKHNNVNLAANHCINSEVFIL